MGIFDQLEARFDEALKHVTGQDRRDLNAMVSAAKAAEDAVIARLYLFKPQLLKLIADAEPAIKQAAGAGVEQLVADVVALLGAVPPPTPPIQPNPLPVPVTVPPAQA
jgi:hypothetical protein